MHRRDVAAVVFGAVALFVVSLPAQAAAQRLPAVTVLSSGATPIVERTVLTFGRYDVGGASVATGELTGDHQAEIVLGDGVGEEPRVRVLTGNGRQISTFLAYDKGFTSGIRVAVGDADGDGSREIVTAPGFGGGPHVRVWTRDGVELFSRGGFFAYEAGFGGGVHVALADVDGDGADEIVTAPGFGGVPEVRAFRPDGTMVLSFLAFEADMTAGLTVAGVDIDGDGRDEVAVGREGAGVGDVRIFRVADGQATFVMSFTATPDGQHAGVTLAAGDVDGDGREEILAAQNAGNGVRAYNASGAMVREWTPFGKTRVDAVRADLADVDGDGAAELVAAPAAPTASATPKVGRHIDVDLARQQLFAWQDGRLAYTFLVSSGTARYPSPKGSFAVFRKVAKMDYVWSYGVNNPNNYRLPNVPWNLNFKPRYYIHAAYWHSNFGNPMSHGCINTSIPDARWMYGWADVGTTVDIL